MEHVYCKTIDIVQGFVTTLTAGSVLCSVGNDGELILNFKGFSGLMLIFFKLAFWHGVICTGETQASHEIMELVLARFLFLTKTVFDPIAAKD